MLSKQQWADYHRDGFVRLGEVVDANGLKKLQDRIDDIMLGRAATDASRLLMQLDSNDGAYQNAGEQSLGFKGATLNYRKIQNLEIDDVFRAFTERPLFKDICAHVYGEVSVAAFRAMFMNKPARAGTLLPWHQDRWSDLDRDPLITVWTALDPATVDNGCVQIIRGSHRLGLLNPEHGSGFVSPENIEKHAPDDKVEYLELKAGEAVLLHNWLLHRSDTNNSNISRRAFSVCYMDAQTQSLEGSKFATLWQESAVAA